MREQSLGRDLRSGTGVPPNPWHPAGVAGERPMIELDLAPPSPLQARRRPAWPLIGLVLIASVAALTGHSHQPDAPNLGTVVRAAGVFECQSGLDTALEIDVVNQLGAAITLSRVAVDVVGAPSLRTAFGPARERGPCRQGWSWQSAPQRLVLAPDDLAVVFLGYRRVCRPRAGPIFSSVLVTIETGDRKIIRDITPDPESLSEVNRNSAVTCNT